MTQECFGGRVTQSQRQNVSLTCKMFTDWNRTNFRSICRPSFTVSSGSSWTSAASGSSASSTSSKPNACRLMSNLINLGPSCELAVCRTMLLILTAWLNWWHNDVCEQTTSTIKRFVAREQTDVDAQ